MDKGRRGLLIALAGGVAVSVALQRWAIRLALVMFLLQHQYVLACTGPRLEFRSFNGVSGPGLKLLRPLMGLVIRQVRLISRSSKCRIGLVRRLLVLALVVGALVGLFGQQAAFASGPSWPLAAITSDEASDDKAGADCMSAMQDEESDRPCKGLTLDCIAAMGCVVPLTLSVGPLPVEKLALARQPSDRKAAARLAGRTLAPEPEPPSPLI